MIGGGGSQPSVYGIDGFENPAATVATLHARGYHVVCYISVGSWENWRPDAQSFPASTKLKSNGWPGEKWLDIRRIDLLAPIMVARLKMCADKGFDAVHPDNMDGYSNRTGAPLTFDRMLIDRRGPLRRPTSGLQPRRHRRRVIPDMLGDLTDSPARRA